MVSEWKEMKGALENTEESSSDSDDETEQQQSKGKSRRSKCGRCQSTACVCLPVCRPPKPKCRLPSYAFHTVVARQTKSRRVNSRRMNSRQANIRSLFPRTLQFTLPGAQSPLQRYATHVTSYTISPAPSNTSAITISASVVGLAVTILSPVTLLTFSGSLPASLSLTPTTGILAEFTPTRNHFFLQNAQVSGAVFPYSISLTAGVPGIGLATVSGTFPSSFVLPNFNVAFSLAELAPEPPPCTPCCPPCPTPCASGCGCGKRKKKRHSSSSSSSTTFSGNSSD